MLAPLYRLSGSLTLGMSPTPNLGAGVLAGWITMRLQLLEWLQCTRRTVTRLNA